MKAIILAAGGGLRLNGLTATPKCLLEVGGRTLLQRQQASLRACGIQQIVVVVGFRGDLVRAACDDGTIIVENSRFAETNSLYSLWLAREHLTDGFVVLNADVLFHHAMLEELLCSPHHAALLMSPRGEGDQLFGAEEMKVKVEGDLVRDISKDMDPAEADGENVGIVKFGPSEAERLVSFMEQLVASGGSGHWAPRAFRAFAAHRDLHAIGTRKYPWIEIDSPEDYFRAIHEICPRLP